MQLIALLGETLVYAGLLMMAFWYFVERFVSGVFVGCGLVVICRDIAWTLSFEQAVNIVVDLAIWLKLDSPEGRGSLSNVGHFAAPEGHSKVLENRKYELVMKSFDF